MTGTTDPDLDTLLIDVLAVAVGLAASDGPETTQSRRRSRDTRRQQTDLKWAFAADENDHPLLYFTSRHIPP